VTLCLAEEEISLPELLFNTLKLTIMNKFDEAVVRAKALIVVDEVTPLPKMKGQPVQLSLFG
jgi:hypothetical protein